MNDVVHSLTRREIFRRVLSLREEGHLYDLANPVLDEVFAEPVLYEGKSFFPVRHNREFTRDELMLLLRHGGFRHIEVEFLKSRHYRNGLERIKSIATAVRDAVPSLRKSLIAFAEK